MDLSVLTNTIILAMCYVLGSVIKTTEKISSKYIPAVLFVFGGVLGLAHFFSGAADFSAESPVMAFIIGSISGFASVGVNQLLKQTGKMITKRTVIWFECQYIKLKFNQLTTMHLCFPR